MGLLFPRLPALGQSERPIFSLTGAVTAHAALITMIAVVVPTDELKQALRPLAVRLVEAVPALPKQQPVRPKEVPRPQRMPPPPETLLVSNTVSESPPTFTTPPPTSPAPTAPVNVAPAPEAVTAPRFDADYLDNPKPVYPATSRRLGEQGKVLLRVLVSASGLAEKVELKTGSNFARLDQAAQEAVSRWRFVPARRGEQPIAAWVQVPVTFQLDN